MESNNSFDVIIVGGSYSGLAAGMALGRAMMRVLIVDDGQPCNRQTPYSHNFLTNDGKPPAEIAFLANLQVSAYDTIKFFRGIATRGQKTSAGFEIETGTGEKFAAKKLVFATGIEDLLPDIPGIAECWGISVLHCPYCHGYEVRNRPTGILGNGDVAFEFTLFISNWTKNLSLFTNGKSVLTKDQRNKLDKFGVRVVENEISAFEQNDGYIGNIVFKDGTINPIEAVYAHVPFKQHCKIPALLGCELTEEGYIRINDFYQTSIEGVYAAGDNASRMRTIANAVGMGTAAGMFISKSMILGEV